MIDTASECLSSILIYVASSLLLHSLTHAILLTRLDFQTTTFIVIHNYSYRIGPDWTMNQAGLGKSATNFGQLVDRHGKKGSPVVPGSLQKVLEDGESVLYTVTVLRSMYEVRECSNPIR